LKNFCFQSAIGASVKLILGANLAWALLVTSLPANANLVAAVLPSSRAERVGQFTTFFATLINTGTETLQNCGASVSNGVPGTFWFRPADPTTNSPLGERSTVANIAAGAAQAFYLEFRADAELAPVEVQFAFTCDGTEPAPVVSGVNTLVFSAGTVEPIDMVALTATTTGDGIVNLPTDETEGFFAVSTVNLGPVGSARARPIARGFEPSGLLICATDRFTGACESALADSVTEVVGRNSVQTYAVLVKTAEDVAFDPAVNRVAVEFTDSTNLLRGATSVAVRSADLTISGTPASSVLAGDPYRFVPRVGRRTDRSITYSLINAPGWLSFSSTGELVGTPTQADAGLYSGIELVVDDGVVTARIGPFSIEVMSSAWRAGPTLPDLTLQHSMAVVAGNLYYMGGQRQPQSLRQYQASQNTWISRTASPEGVQLGRAETIGGKIHLLGGRGISISSSSNVLQVYDPNTNDWTQSDPPFDTYGFGSAAVDGVFYAFGGVSFRTGGGASTDLWLFNTASQEWTQGPPVPVRCDGLSATAIGRSVYVTGGCNDGTLYVLGGFSFERVPQGEMLNTVYRYDPTSDQWSQAQPMRAARSAFGAAVFEGEIWVTGGLESDRTEIYTPGLDVPLDVR